jgi:hypothetical protein
MSLQVLHEGKECKSKERHILVLENTIHKTPEIYSEKSSLIQSKDRKRLGREEKKPD